jgi:prefoldin subunit 5
MTEEQTEQLISALKDISEAAASIDAGLSNLTQLFEECTYLLETFDDDTVKRVIRYSGVS